MSDLAIDLRDATAVSDLLNRAVAVLHEQATRRGGSVILPARGRLLVTGDLHDNPTHLRKIIHLARLDQSPDHHVVLHEMIHGEHLLNGMDFSHRMLIRVAQLVERYPGQAHPLLANHELSQWSGQGVSKGAGNSVELFNDALAYVYGDAWEEVAGAIGKFIRAMPLALRSESGLLCAHSLPAARQMKLFDLEVLDRELTENDYESQRGSAYLMVWGREHTEEQIETLARKWNVSLFCLGHRYVETGAELVMPRVMVLNSDHERGSVLTIDLAEVPEGETALMMVMPLAAVSEPEDEPA